MNKSWYDKAWDDYLYWQAQGKKTLKRINQLIKDAERNPFGGIGKKEPEYKHDGKFYHISPGALTWDDAYDFVENW